MKKFLTGGALTCAIMAALILNSSNAQMKAYAAEADVSGSDAVVEIAESPAENALESFDEAESASEDICDETVDTSDDEDVIVEEIDAVVEDVPEESISDDEFLEDEALEESADDEYAEGSEYEDTGEYEDAGAAASFVPDEYDGDYEKEYREVFYDEEMSYYNGTTYRDADENIYSYYYYSYNVSGYFECDGRIFLIKNDRAYPLHNKDGFIYYYDSANTAKIDAYADDYLSGKVPSEIKGCETSTEEIAIFADDEYDGNYEDEVVYVAVHGDSGEECCAEDDRHFYNVSTGWSHLLKKPILGVGYTKYYADEENKIYFLNYVEQEEDVISYNQELHKLYNDNGYLYYYNEDGTVTLVDWLDAIRATEDWSGLEDRDAFIPAQLNGKDVKAIDKNIHLETKDFFVEEGNAYLSSIDGVLFDAEGKTLLAYPRDHAYPYYHGESYTVPEGTEAIAEDAFGFECMIERIVIPGTVKEIKDYTFETCFSLSEVILEEGVESIGTGAFAFCTSLKNIELPNSIKEIGDFPFSCDYFLVEGEEGMYAGVYREGKITIVCHSEAIRDRLIALDKADEYNVIFVGASTIVSEDGTATATNVDGSAFDENVILVIKRLDAETALDSNIIVMFGDSEFAAYDITLQKDGVEVQPDGSIKVSIAVPEGMDGEKCSVYRVEEGGTLTNMNATYSLDRLYFVTEHLSTYIVAEDKKAQNNTGKEESASTGSGATESGSTNGNPNTADHTAAGAALGFMLASGVAAFFTRKRRED